MPRAVASPLSPTIAGIKQSLAGVKFMALPREGQGRVARAIRSWNVGAKSSASPEGATSNDVLECRPSGASRLLRLISRGWRPWLHDLAPSGASKHFHSLLAVSGRDQHSEVHPTPGRRASGMTLVELLLVLALLVIIGSLIVPIFFGSFSTARLRRAGDQVLARWSQARARAIESGDIYQFRYASGSGTFQIERWLPVVDESGQAATRPTSAAAGSTSTSPATNASKANNDDASAVVNAALPEEVVFQSGQIAVEGAAAEKSQVEAMEARGASLSTPILFFPDGTTSQASLVLANARQQYVRLTLRGLTGVGRATGVLTRDELQRTSRSR
jgi:Tfp pilus assembly protein FimT